MKAPSPARTSAPSAIETRKRTPPAPYSPFGRSPGRRLVRMRRRLRRCILVLSFGGTAALLSTGSAAACPCSEFCGPVIDHGSTLYRVPWRITAFERPAIGPQPPSAEFRFSTGPCGNDNGAGYFAAFDLPISRRLAFRALAGSSVDEFPESDLSGITSRRATTLILRLSDGSSEVIRPQLAPADLRRRWPWLNRVRAFDAYFESGLKPAGLAACDSRGRLIAKQAATRYFSFESAIGTGADSNLVCPVSRQA